MIASGLPDRYGIDVVAKNLGMSKRSLNRRFREENSSFKSILSSVRTELAKQYLKAKRMSVDEVAVRLCYTESPSFRRAFKNWTGINMGEFRKNEVTAGYSIGA